MATAAAAYEGGGIGGKFRKRPFRRTAATPYDRPPSAPHAFRGNPVAAAAGGNGGWLSKLVDPASRLITRGATRFFSSVFRKRLGAPPAAPEATFESREEVPDVVSINPLPVIQEGGKDEESSKKKSDGDGISELEQLLKQKTFTRVEFDRLTELLRSRTVDPSEEDAKKRIESSTSPPAVNYKIQETPLVSAQGNEIEDSKFFGSISTPSARLNILEEEVASAAELAKAYMSSRPSKVSPSTLSLRSQALRESTTLPIFVPFSPKPSEPFIAPRSVVRFSGISGPSENGYSTPRPRDRSAMYKMSRSLYFKGHTPVTLKSAEPTGDGYVGPSTLIQWKPTNLALSSGKQALKRRSSALESDIGSFGPIRRIRQKSNLISPSKDVAENGEHRISSAGFTSVPPQSSETARTFLQQLDKLVPSPKEKSSKVKAIAMGESPSKLTVDMLSGQALKSVADIDSSNLFNVEANGKFDVTNGLQSTSPRTSISQKQDRAMENGPSKPTISGSKLAYEANGKERVKISVADATKPGVRPSDSVFLGSAAAPPKKPAFKMQVPEDSLELDDDNHDSRDASGLSVGGKEKLDSTESEQEFVISDTANTKRPFAFSSENKLASIFSSSKEAEKGGNDGLVVAEKDIGFTFQVGPSPGSLSQPPPTPTMSSPLVDKLAPSKEQTAVPVFGFGTKSAPTLTFSSTITSFSDPTGLNLGVKSNSKVQLLGSSSATETTIPTAPVETTDSDKVDKIQRAGDFFGKSVSSALSTRSTPSIFAFAASTTSSQSNGSLKSTSSIFSVSAATVTSLSGSSMSPSISISSATTSNLISAPVSTTAPTVPTLPMFQFGADSSTVVTSSTSSPVVKSDSTDLKSEPTKESPLGVTSSAPEASSTLSGVGSSIFGFGASASSGSIFSGTTGSLFLTQATQSGSGISPFTQSTTSQLGSSASSPTFGLAGSSSFGLSSTAFGSSTSGAKPFSSSVFGQSSAVSFTTSAASSLNSVSSSSLAPPVATSSLFGSSTQPATSSIFGFGFGSGSAVTSPSTGFSVSPAAPVTAPSMFGASSGPVLSFTSAATTSSLPAASATASLSFGASSGSVFSFTSASTTTSLAPAVPAFGMSTPAMSFGSGSPGNDQMNVEDSMADDTAQISTPMVPTFGQPAGVPAPSNLTFGSPALPSAGSVFQFTTPQGSAFPQSPSLFQASGNFSPGGGSFSLGSGAGDKAGRRIIKAKRDKHRKK